MRAIVFRSPPPRARRRAALMAACAATLLIAGCSKMSDITGSIGGSQTMPRDEAGMRQFADQWARRYDANPKDKNVALTYARALRSLSRHSEAVAVLQGAAITHPQDQEVLGAFGKALADAGRLREAADVLTRAHTPERPNWSILNAQGSVADQLGDHAGAQSYYSAALKIAPGEPSIHSNLGLSYAMAKQLPQAEQQLRSASQMPGADMRVRQNLSLVLALQGKFSEAEDVARRDLPPAEATASIASIRAMIAQSNTWREIQKLDGAPAKPRRSAKAG